DLCRKTSSYAKSRRSPLLFLSRTQVIYDYKKLLKLMCAIEQTCNGKANKLGILITGVKHMENRKFIVSVVLTSIFLAPALVAAENNNSEFQVGEFVKDSAITAQIKTKLLAAEDIDSLRI